MVEDFVDLLGKKSYVLRYRKELTFLIFNIIDFSNLKNCVTVLVLHIINTV